MVLGKAETAENDVTSQHSSQIPKVFLLCLSLLGRGEDIFSENMRTEQFISL